jgi:hypothetical protein
LVFGIAFFSSIAHAQETSTIINSDPPGAAISLDGEYQLNATTPCRLPENISGIYELKALMPGYESWNGEIMIAPGQSNRFSFALAPKTRLKSAMRSVFIPGWGQYYSGQKERAFIFSLTAIGFGIGAVIADSDFRKKRDDYNRAKLDLADAASADEVSQLRDLVIERNRQAYDAETTRNMLVIITAGVYVYNVLDALIFFPDKKLIFQGTVPVDMPKIETGFDGEEINVKLTASF